MKHGKSANVWLFQANPKYYDLVAYLEHAQIGDEDEWAVNQSWNQMRIGDTVLFWLSGKKAGIYAIGELIGQPELCDPQPSEDDIAKYPYLKSKRRVRVRYTHILDKPITRDFLKTHPILRDLEIIRFSNATNFRVKPEQWAAFKPLLFSHESSGIKSKLSSLLKDLAALSHLSLPPDLLSAYYTALKTKGFVILTGVSGTGKTKLAMAFAELFGDEEEGACFVAVRPDWRDSRGLLGYWNPMENVYESTPFLRALLRAAQEFGEPSAPPFDGFTTTKTETLEDSLKRWLNGKGVQAWIANYRAFVERVKATPVLNPAFPLHDLWHPQKNAVANVGAAPALQVADEELKHVTEILADTEKPVGERLVEAMQAFEQLPISERPWARTLRALAALDPEHATVLLKSRDLRAALRALGYERGFSLTYSTERGHAQKITDAFEFLQTQLRQLLKRIGQKDDAVLRSTCAWLTHSWAWSQSAEVEHARPDVSGVFVILDEMNLARVEHYFSDFLSVLESGRRDDGWTQQAIVLHHQQTAVPDRSGIAIPPELRLPPHLYIIGTVNVDETTSTFSPKVLDRAFTLEFSEVSFMDYPPTPTDAKQREAWDLLREEARVYLSQQSAVSSQQSRFLLREKQAEYGSHVNPFLDFVNYGRFLGWTETEKKQCIAEFLSQYPHFRDHLEHLKTLLAPHNLHFGYRVFDEIVLFLINAQSPVVFDGFGSPDAAFDCAVYAKVLPKFHGSRAKLEEPLVKVRLWCEMPNDVDAVMQGCKEAMAALRKGETRQAQILYPRTASKCLRMLRELYETGFASFA